MTSRSSDAALADRVVGCVLGLALGDAAGAPFEFRRAHEVPDPIPVFELPWRGGPAGSTTDETALARNLVRSLSARGRLDPSDLIERHLAWYRAGPPDVGTLTRLVLEAAERGEPAATAAKRIWQERGPEVSGGNGSVMYCAPLGAAHARRPELLAESSVLLSGLTHHDPRCATAVLAVTLAVAALVRGTPPKRALHEALTRTIDREGGEELEFLVEAAGSVRPVDGPDQGFCLFTAGLGLQVLTRDERFEEAILGVVRLGGDADTNAAVAGAVLGARDGRAGLPDAWLDRLEERDDIDREARALIPLASRET